jgi:hypothetical protein
MADYTIKRLEDVPDVLGDYPGEMRMMTGDLEAEQVAFTYRRMPQHTGGKGSYGHRHKQQEEVYFVASGKLQFKLNDEIFDLERGTAVRVPPRRGARSGTTSPRRPSSSSSRRSSPAAHVTTPSTSRTSGRNSGQVRNSLARDSGRAEIPEGGRWNPSPVSPAAS